MDRNPRQVPEGRDPVDPSGQPQRVLQGDLEEDEGHGAPGDRGPAWPGPEDREGEGRHHQDRGQVAQLADHLVDHLPPVAHAEPVTDREAETHQHHHQQRAERGDQDRCLLAVALRVGARLLARVEREAVDRLGATLLVQSAAHPEHVDDLAAGQVGPQCNVALPESALRRPSITRMAVDFPAPLGPRKPCSSPGSTARLSPSRARTGPKVLTRSRSSMAQSEAAVRPPAGSCERRCRRSVGPSARKA